MSMFGQEKDGENLSFLQMLRHSFIYGLVVLVPIIATLLFMKILVQVISVPNLLLFQRELNPFLGFFLTLLLIFVIGVVARHFVGKIILDFLESVIIKIPIVNVFYRSAKHIVTAVSSKKDRFLSVVLLEYPRKGMWALGFVTKENASGVLDDNKVNLTEDMACVFVPTTPNPTSGYFVYIKRDELRPLDMSVEEGIKTLMSAGVV